MKKFDLQLFAAPENMTGQAQFSTISARDIDFVSSFSKDTQALLDVLGITRMIKKANGTRLTVIKASGALGNGAVGEGEEIPLSQYGANETEIGTISIKKYGKGVSLEAISKYGYEVAVEKTDEEFKAQLRNVVTDQFYDFLKTGTLASSETTWQMAIAMAIGRVKHKFQSMAKTATGVVLFVNTLDVYQYIGSAAISTQTAFGMSYIKDFMGADTVFMTDKIERGTVIGTPVNNLIAYYVDPADSEFSRAGLEYVTDNETGFIGFHSQGNYSRAISEAYALMGMTVMAEYLDAVAVITVDSTPTLGTLTVTSAAGTASGDTKITVSPVKEAATNVYKYKIGDAAETVVYGQNVKTWSVWNGVDDITAATGKTITVVEADASYQAQATGSATVTAKA